MTGVSMRYIRALLALTTAFVLTMFGGDARAGNPITFQWETRAVVEDAGDWNAFQLEPEGYGHFVVNGTALPTRTVPGQYRPVPYKVAGTNNYFVNAEHNLFQAALNAPRGIMRVGSNTVQFRFGNVLSHATGRHSITAHGAPIRNPTLFRLATAPNIIDHWLTPDNDAFDANDVVDSGEIDEAALVYSTEMTLDQLDPELVADLKAFEASLQQTKAALIQNAAAVVGLAHQLDDLARLETELADLLTRDLGEDLAAALDALLARYTEVPAATRAALVKVITDLERSIADIQAELGQITADFSGQVNDVVGMADGLTATPDWDPGAVASYLPAIDPSTIPAIAIPDASGGPFDAAHDPYKAYADQVIAKLGQYVSGNDVVARHEFSSVVHGWRDNQKALEDALRVRGYPLQETNAFNAARNTVLDYLRRFIDGQDWFIDNPVPADVRSAIDSIVAQHLVDLVRPLKDAMNQWRGSGLSPDQELAVETVSGVLAAGEELDDDPSAIARIRNTIQGAIAGISGGLRLGIGFLPIAGDMLDMCEAITGYEFCTSTGAPLSVSDRVLSGLSVIAGNGKVWRAAAHGTRLAARAVVLARIGRIADNLSDLSPAARKALLARIGHIVEHLDDLSGTEILRLTNLFGDLPMMQLAPKLKSNGLAQLERMEFFLPRMNAAVQTAAATRGAAVKALPPMKGKTLTEVRGILQQAQFTKDAGSTVNQEVWLYKQGGGDGSVVRIALTGTNDRPWLHYKREISFTTGYADADIACKLTESGTAVPAGPNQAGELLRQWYRATVGETVVETSGGPLDLMLKYWGDTTHIPLQ